MCWVSVLPLGNMLDILVLKIFYDVEYIHAIISDNSMKSLGKENQTKMSPIDRFCYDLKFTF